VFTTSPWANPLRRVRLLAGVHDGLAGVDPGSHGEVEARMLLVQLLDRIEHPEAGPHGALGVVAMRDWGAEHSHDRVAEELLHDAAERFDFGLHPGVIGHEHGPNVLGVGLVRARGEVDQVDEQHRDDLALFDRRLDGQGRATGRTVSAPLGILLPTSPALGHEEQSMVGFRSERGSRLSRAQMRRSAAGPKWRTRRGPGLSLNRDPSTFSSRRRSAMSFGHFAS
jgi:hypothetical protein